LSPPLHFAADRPAFLLETIRQKMADFRHSHGFHQNVLVVKNGRNPPLFPYKPSFSVGFRFGGFRFGPVTALNLPLHNPGG
jgi:hypothetical protein